MAQDFDAEDKKLEEIIFAHGRRFMIPRNQRPYAWEPQQVEDFIEDLFDENVFFFGTFVFNVGKEKESGFIEVIDGQQRIITLTILSAVIRDIFSELKYSKGVKLIQDNDISPEDQKTGDKKYKLEVSDNLHDFFLDYIQSNEKIIDDSKPKKTNPESKRVKENYKIIKDRILEELKDVFFDSDQKKIDFLMKFRSHVYERKAIEIKIDDEDDAYLIFETVNARGADLTQADLIKNYLFREIRPNDKEGDLAKLTWQYIQEKVEGGPLSLSKFLRYYYVSKYDFVLEKGLFKEIKKRNLNLQELLADLKKYADVYYLTTQGSLDEWEEFIGDKIRTYKIYWPIYGLREMGITQFFPLLFVFLVNKDKINFDFSQDIAKIEKHHFKYSGICKQPGNIVEKIYSKTSRQVFLSITESTGSEKEIREELITTLNNFTNQLPKVNKELFEEKFNEIEFSRQTKKFIQYFLGYIERKKSTNEFIPNWKEITVEHILPQEPIKWKLKQEDIKDYVNSLGNLTLIDRKINGKMENKTLVEKIKDFSLSKFTINQEFIKQLKKDKKGNFIWDKETISTRKKELMDICWKMWN